MAEEQPVDVPALRRPPGEAAPTCFSTCAKRRRVWPIRRHRGFEDDALLSPFTIKELIPCYEPVALKKLPPKQPASMRARAHVCFFFFLRKQTMRKKKEGAHIVSPPLKKCGWSTLRNASLFNATSQKKTTTTTTKELSRPLP